MNDNAVTLLNYDLPDAVLLTDSGMADRCMIWTPERECVVIGNGSSVDNELHLDRIAADGIPVYRRDSGGCAVVLTPDMIVCSFAIYGAGLRDSIGYFSYFNSIVIDALRSLGVDGLKHRGTSDIAIANRKIAGTAIYRNKHVTFYHAIINLAGDTSPIERYLKMPPRMPDYRNGRSHAEFITSVSETGINPSRSEIEGAVLSVWKSRANIESMS
jgi:lipoate-protein ligase A